MIRYPNDPDPDPNPVPAYRHHCKQRMAAVVVPDPVASMNLQPSMEAVHETPATPWPLLPTAPRMPVTWVPCPLSSVA